MCAALRNPLPVACLPAAQDDDAGPEGGSGARAAGGPAPPGLRPPVQLPPAALHVHGHALCAHQHQPGGGCGAGGCHGCRSKGALPVPHMPCSHGLHLLQCTAVCLFGRHKPASRLYCAAHNSLCRSVCLLVADTLSPRAYLFALSDCVSCSGWALCTAEQPRLSSAREHSGMASLKAAMLSDPEHSSRGTGAAAHRVEMTAFCSFCRQCSCCTDDDQSHHTASALQAGLLVDHQPSNAAQAHQPA